MKNKKALTILFLHGDTYPTFRSEITELFQREMQLRGHKIHYVLLTEVSNKKVIKIQGNNIYHLIPRKKGVFSTLREQKEIKKIAKDIVDSEKIDIIQARDDIFLTKLADKLSKKYNIPLAFHLTTLFHSLDKDLIKHRNSLGNLFRYLRGDYTEHSYNKLIKQSNLFLPISEAMAQHYRTKFPKKKMLPLPLHAPRSFINHSVPKNKSASKKRIIYIGQISYIRNMNFMIDILNHLPNDVEMMFVGPPQQDFVVNEMVEYAKKLGVNNKVKIIGKVDKKDIPKYITSAKVGISPIPPLEAFKMSSPTKVVEYLSLGVPVVANKEIKDQRYVIEKSGGGYAVDYDVKLFANKINELLENPDKGKKMGNEGREWIKKHRNYKILAKKLEKAYYELLNQ